MSFEFRSPNLNGQTPETQIQQILSFLRQHIQQLNWVFQNVDVGEKTSLTEDQLKAVTDTVSQSAEVFQSFYRKIRKKQVQENFVGAAKKAILENGSWSQGSSVSADMEAVGRYTLFVVVAGTPAVCARQGSTIHGEGLALTCGDTAITVTEAANPVTAVYAII